MKPHRWWSLLVLAVLAACSEETPAEDPLAPDYSIGVTTNPGLHRAIDVQNAHTPSLLKIPGVIGTGVGMDAFGNPIVKVFLSRSAVRGLPSHLGGFAVAPAVTGEFTILADPTDRRRPVPVGYSIGHPDVTAGTFGARVKNASGHIFILSNNHVIADVNAGSIGDPILQPGPIDGGITSDSVAWLADFEPIHLDGTTNYLDAAIARGNPSTLQFWTSADGYGIPTSRIFGDNNADGFIDDKTALLGLSVQKYGRTTGLTSGTIDAINVVVDVCYERRADGSCLRQAHFEDQIAISSGFGGPGDSGSLIVTNNSYREPVGLLFAGGASTTLANRIDLVLDRFNVDVDAGEPLTVAIDGQTCLYNPDYYPYQATTAGGAGGYSWTWQRDKAPYDGWSSAGGGQVASLYFGAGSYGERLRVTVTDAAGQTRANVFQVYMETGGSSFADEATLQGNACAQW